MAIKKIRKRNGDIADFEKEKITEAIWKAAKSVGGKDRKTSVMRMMISSTTPPNPPAIAPSGIPISNARPTAISAVCKEIRVP